MKLSRLIRQPDALNVLVTACDLNVSRLSNKFNVVQWGEPTVIPKKVLMEEIVNVQGLLCLLRDKIDSEVISAAKNLRVIATLSAGYDHIDVEECKKRGIIVTNTPDVLTEVTAETTVALLLATARRFPEAINEARTGRWSTWSLYYMCGVGVYRSTIGIIGLGRIGLSVAEKLKAFKPARILYHNRKPNKGASKVGAEYVSLDELLEQSDFVILTCAYSPEMKGFINEDTLSKMKESAILINTSRGALINQDDLYVALLNGRIRAAGLDVTTPEPLPTSSPLFSLPNCLILPHIGSATNLARSEMFRLAEDGILSVLNGLEIPQNIRVV